MHTCLTVGRRFVTIFLSIQRIRKQETGLLSLLVYYIERAEKCAFVK